MEVPVSVADWCLFAAVMLALLPLGPLKWARRGRFDNARPRDPGFYADPLAARVRGAHQNGLEALPFFMVAVVLAELRAVPQGWVDGLALGFVVLRAGYVAAYVWDRPSLRSLLWISAFVANLAIFVLPALGRG